jgi:hypothetical protein
MMVKPEHIADMQAKLAKLDKASKSKAKPKIPALGLTRRYPNDSTALASTKAYVEAFLRQNPMLEFVDGAKGYVLSDSPTVWPDPALDTVETIEE